MPQNDLRNECSNELSLSGIFPQKNNNLNLNLQVPNRELLHAIVALYDVCLPDITPEVLYDTVAGKGAKTLILIRDPKGNNEFLEKEPVAN